MAVGRVSHAERDVAFKVDADFPSRLRDAICASGLPLNRFAYSIGYDRKVVYYWLSGKGVPNADALHTICRLYGIDPRWLLMGGVNG